MYTFLEFLHFAIVANNLLLSTPYIAKTLYIVNIDFAIAIPGSC